MKHPGNKTKISTSWTNGSHKEVILFLAAVLMLNIVIYSPSFSGTYLWDDTILIGNNKTVTSINGLPKIWFSTSNMDYYPLTWTFFWVEWHLWDGNLISFRLINVILHGINSTLIFILLRFYQIKGSHFAAFVFAVHPVNVVSVAYIAQQKNTLSMLLYLLSILVYSKYFHRSKYVLLSLLLFVLALLAKSAAIMLPVVLIGMHWSISNQNKKENLLRLVPFFGVSIFFAVFNIWYHGKFSIGDIDVYPEGIITRTISAGVAFWFYLYKSIIPLNLMFVYPRWNFDSNKYINFIPLFSIVLLFFLFWIKRRGWGKPFLLGFGYFFILLFPTLGFFENAYMQHSLVADHWQYFAIIGVLSLTTHLLISSVSKLKLSTNYPKIFLTIIIITLCGLTYNRSQFFYNKETIWSHQIQQQPDSFIGNLNYGTYIYNKDGFSKAEPYFKKVIDSNSGQIDFLADKIKIQLATIFVSNNCLAQAEQVAFKLRWKDTRDSLVSVFQNNLTADAMNNLAYYIIANPKNDFSKRKIGLGLIMHVINFSTVKKIEYYDTLIAAYCSLNDFQNALKTCDSAIEFELSQKNYDTAEKFKLRKQEISEEMSIY